MTYNCLVIDDEELARELIENHLSQLDDFVVVASCASALEARKALQKEKIDLLFLDIEMPLIKGTDFFRNLVQKPKVIFTTAYRDYAIDGFELNAVDYLLKPITFERLFRAIEKFIALENKTDHNPTLQLGKPTEKFVFIRKDRKQFKLILDEVLYVESLKDYVKIYTSQKTHTVKYSITAFQELLGQNFLRVHRSFIINIDKVTAYSKIDIEIGEKHIPIGESYRNSIAAYFEDAFRK